MVEYAIVVMLMWLFHDMLFDIGTQRYLLFSVCLSSVPLKE